MAADRRPRRRGSPVTSPDESPGANPPKQLRSVDALQRIGAAAMALLEERDYDDVSVSDIAAAAGISVGAFYIRFRSKERLIAFLLRDVRNELTEQLRHESDPARWQHAGMDEIVAWYLNTMAAAFVRHRAVLRPATIIARHTQDAELRQLLTEFNTEAHGRFRALLLARRQHIARPDPEAAINSLLLWVSAAIREAVLYREPVSSLGSRDYRALTRELTVAAVAYLRAPHP